MLACDRATELRPDPREFRSIQWVTIDGQRQWPAARFDPQLGRFISKLTAALN